MELSKKEIELILKLRDEASGKIKTFRQTLKEFSKSATDSVAPIISLRQAWMKASLAIGATTAVFTYAAAQISKLREEQSKLDLMSIKLGISSEALSKKLYGIRIESENARLGADSWAIFADSVQRIPRAATTTVASALGVGSVSARANMIYEAKASKYQEDNKITIPFMGGSIQNPFAPFGDTAKQMREEARREAIKQIEDEAEQLRERKAIESGLVAETIQKTKQMEMSAYAYKIQLLNAEIAQYRASGVTKTAVTRYEAAARKRIEEDYTNEVKNQQATILESQGNTLEALRLKQESALVAYKRQWGADGEAVRAFIRGQQETLRQAQYTYLGVRTNSQIIRDSYLSAVNAMGDAMGSFYDTTTGEFQSLGKVATNFGRTIIGIINQMIAQFILAKAIMGISSMFSGGTVGNTGKTQSQILGFNTAAYKHSGGRIYAHEGLAIDEVPIVALRGEGVLSRQGMSSLGRRNFEKLNSGESIGEKHVHYHATLVVQALEPSDIIRNKSTFEAIIVDSLRRAGSVSKAVKKYS